MDSHEVRRQWAKRSGEYSPAYYAYRGPDERSEAVRRTLDRFVDRDARVLEVGCSAGRHLAHLHEHGYENLVGVEVNPEAFDVMAETYPDLAAEGTFHCDAIENVVGDVEDGAFDATFSVETLQHVHPDAAWVFEELARITGDLLVTVENEGGTEYPAERGVNYVDDGVPLYYRDWNEIFTQFGFVEVDVDADGRDTVRVFRTT